MYEEGHPLLTLVVQSVTVVMAAILSRVYEYCGSVVDRYCVAMEYGSDQFACQDSYLSDIWI